MMRSAGSLTVFLACGAALTAGANPAGLPGTGRSRRAAAAFPGADHRLVAVASGETLHVVTLGHGAPVVLLPSLFTSAFAFRKLAPGLVAAGHRVIIIEPLGVGDSARPASANYSLSAQSRRVATVLRSLGVDRAILVAHSVGASIALRVALSEPTLVGAVISIEGGAVEGPVTEGFRRALRFAPLLRLFGAAALRAPVRRALRRRSANPGWVTEGIVEGYMAGAAEDPKGTLTAYQAMGRSREEEPLIPRLSGVRCPVWLLVGTAAKEGGTSEHYVTTYERELPSFSVERVGGAGHFLYEERPDAVLEIVERAQQVIQSQQD